jgi:hypothetical protein
MSSLNINRATYIPAPTHTSTGEPIPSIAQLDALLASRLGVRASVAREKENAAIEPAKARGKKKAVEDLTSQAPKEEKVFIKLRLWKSYQPPSAAEPRSGTAQPQPHLKRKRNDSEGTARDFETRERSRTTSLPAQQENELVPQGPEYSLHEPATAEPERKFARIKTSRGWQRPEARVARPPPDFEWGLGTSAGGPEEWKRLCTEGEVDRAWRRLKKEWMKDGDFVKND